MENKKPTEFLPEDYTWSIFKDQEKNPYGEYDIVLIINEFDVEYRFSTASEAEKEVLPIIEGLMKSRVEGQKLPLPIPLKYKKDFSGKFVLRVSPETHRKLYMEAIQKNTSLNSLIESYISAS